MKEFNSESELRHWAKINGYDAGGIQRLLEDYRNKKQQEVSEKTDNEETPEEVLSSLSID